MLELSSREPVRIAGRPDVTGLLLRDAAGEEAPIGFSGTARLREINELITVTPHRPMYLMRDLFEKEEDATARLPRGECVLSAEVQVYLAGGHRLSPRTIQTERWLFIP